jgi:hypothetical protein
VQVAGPSSGFILNTLLECIFRGYVKASSHKINNINELHKPEIIIIIIIKKPWRAGNERGERGGIVTGANLQELSDIMEPDVTLMQNCSYLEVLESVWCMY